MANLIDDFPRIANTVTELTRVSGLTAEYEILSNSERHIEQTNRDNWNGGTDVFTIYLKTTIEIYSRYEAQLSAIEATINSKFQPILRGYPSDAIENVVITPRLLGGDISPLIFQGVLERHAFISYQARDRIIAGSIKQLLEGVGINAFLAHEDIDVSSEWQERILEEISKSSLFICLISANYLTSPWCMQEVGMAILKNITVIPLSLDGAIPLGFIAKYQATRIDVERPQIKDLIPGLLKHDKFDGLNIIIELIGASGSFRMAESNFELLLPYIDDLTEVQIRTLFKHIRTNNQIHHATLCASTYIPSVLRQHRDLIIDDDFIFLRDICAKYGGTV
jgi:hypothetical protein